MRTSRLRIDRSALMLGGVGGQCPFLPGEGGWPLTLGEWLTFETDGRWLTFDPRGWGVNDLSFLWEVVDLSPGEVVDLWPWGRWLTFDPGGGECLPLTMWPIPWCIWCHTSPPLTWIEWVTHTCENITFARFATRAEIISPFINSKTFSSILLTIFNFSFT